MLLIQIIAAVYFILRKIVNSNTTSVFDNYIDMYGEGYGTEWMYFPDGEGNPHNVTLIGDVEDDDTKVRDSYSEVEFRLYTKSNTVSSIVMDGSGEPVMNKFNIHLADRPLKVITHGWRASVDSLAVAGLKDAYLKSQDVNVVTVDWSYTASSIFYYWVANQTESIGIEVAMFLNALNRRYNVTGRQVHLIGHSLGAHVMGIAAYHSNLFIDRITGLDPARPLFEYPSRGNASKLDKSDAKFVDVMHTCSGVLGIEAPIGTVDFYPNSGIPPQPGCDTIPRILEACSHGRSFVYFMESIITPKAFPAYQCSNWAEYLENRCHQYGYMGDMANRNNTGKFYLKTNHKKPYGRSN